MHDGCLSLSSGRDFQLNATITLTHLSSMKNWAKPDVSRFFQPLAYALTISYRKSFLAQVCDRVSGAGAAAGPVSPLEGWQMA